MKWNVTTMRSKTKQDLIDHIQELYVEIGNIMKAIDYIQEDLDHIKNGESWLVHDNP